MNNTGKIIIFIVLLIIVRIVSDNYINSEHVPKDSVHDVCHHYFPKIENSQTKNYIYDFYTIIPIIALYGLIIYNRDAKLFTQATILFIILNLIRPLFYALTVLPDPTERCKTGLTCHSKVYELFTGTCKDLIYSGHVSNSLLALLFLYQYFGLPIIFVFLQQLILVFFMLSQRKHYTIDIIVAYLVTFLLYDKKEYVYDLLKI